MAERVKWVAGPAFAKGEAPAGAALFLWTLFGALETRVLASDTTPLLNAFPVAGGVLGLLFGAGIWGMLWISRVRVRKLWLLPPLLGLAGFVIPILAIRIWMGSTGEKVLFSHGGYEPMRGGMGVLSVREPFTSGQLADFYRHITNKENAVLAPYEFAVALVEQGNGLRQVYLNVRPSLTNTEDYIRVNDEVARLLEAVMEDTGRRRP